MDVPLSIVGSTSENSQKRTRLNSTMKSFEKSQSFIALKKVDGFGILEEFLEDDI